MMFTKVTSMLLLLCVLSTATDTMMFNHYRSNRSRKFSSTDSTENGAAVSYSPESTQIVTNTATKNSFAVGGAGAVDPQPQESTGKTGGAVSDSSVVFAGCRDARLTQIINTALQNYLHDMEQLSGYILNQIVRARYSGYWFVHSAQIGQQRQGVDWQSKSNGDIFASTSTHGCYYHDTQTYIVVIRY